ncbi:MAG: DUF6036 family nucleotidyltransferase [Bacteroidota bacterium]
MLGPDFKEFVRLLNAHNARYLVVGGYAVAVHGYPRFTKDLDIWVEPSEQNSLRTLDALNDFGFASLGITQKDLLDENSVIQLGRPPYRIDILTSLSGVDFATCYEARILIDLDGIEVSFIDVEHLITNKRSTGRSQDLADVENLE